MAFGLDIVITGEGQGGNSAGLIYHTVRICGMAHVLKRLFNSRKRFGRTLLVCGWVMVGLTGFAGKGATEGQRTVAKAKPFLRNLTAVGRLAPSGHLHLALGLPVRNRAALDQLIADLYDPASLRFRQFLTPEQFAEQFGPTEQDYHAVIDFVQKQGLIVGARHSNRMVVEVEGTVGAIESMLHTTLAVYQHPTEHRTFHAPAIDVTIPPSVPVQDIQGLDNYALPRPMSLRHAAVVGGRAIPQFGSAPNGGYRGNDFRAAYAPNVRLTGSGQVVGLLEFEGYYTNDIALYEQDAGLRNVPLQNVLLDHASGIAGTNNPEVALDIEMAISMAPGLSKVMVYEAEFPDSALSRMATDNVAKQISSSWSFPIDSTTDQIFSEFAAQGQAMFEASGDDDAYYAEIPTPSDDPRLTIVGGTTLTTSGPGGGWVSEAAWNWYTTGHGFGGTGGGISQTYVLPAWQKGISMTVNQGSTYLRNLPDVALTADNIWVRDNNGNTEILGGTSAAAPLWAGFFALVNQQSVSLHGTNVGFFNPALYALGKGAKYANGFHDIILGNNTNHHSPTQFFAVPGYDLCTGWGTPHGQALINALTGVTNVAPAFIAAKFVEPSAGVGQLYSGSIATQAVDPDEGDVLTFSKTSGPAWLTVAANGQLSGMPGTTNLGTNTFSVKVTDQGGLSAAATMTLGVTGVPRFLANPFIEPTANAGQAYAATLSTNVTDPTPGAALVFTKLSGSAWLSIGSDGSLSGIPSSIDAGTNSFTVGVSDSAGGSNSATIYLLVNGAPFFFANSLLEPQAAAGQPYSATVATQAQDPNSGDHLTFSKLSGPAWLRVASDGLLSGTPSFADSGTNIFGVQVADSGGLTGSAELFVYVVPALPVSVQLSIHQNQVLLAWTGGAGRFQLQAAKDLTQPNWIDVGPVVEVQTLLLPMTNSTLFYRVQIR